MRTNGLLGIVVILAACKTTQAGSGLRDDSGATAGGAHCGPVAPFPLPANFEDGVTTGVQDTPRFPFTCVDQSNAQNGKAITVSGLHVDDASIQFRYGIFSSQQINGRCYYGHDRGDEGSDEIIVDLAMLSGQAGTATLNVGTFPNGDDSQREQVVTTTFACQPAPDPNVPTAADGAEAGAGWTCWNGGDGAGIYPALGGQPVGGGTGFGSLSTCQQAIAHVVNGMICSRVAKKTFYIYHSDGSRVHVTPSFPNNYSSIDDCIAGLPSAPTTPNPPAPPPNSQGLTCADMGDGHFFMPTTADNATRYGYRAMSADECQKSIGGTANGLICAMANTSLYYVFRLDGKNYNDGHNEAKYPGSFTALDKCVEKIKTYPFNGGSTN